MGGDSIHVDDIKAVVVGRVLENRRDEQQVVLQPYQGLFLYTKIVHKALYREADGSLVPRPDGPGGPLSVVRAVVPYSALVLQVTW